MLFFNLFMFLFCQLVFGLPLKRGISGEGTFYEVGLGSCGQVNSGDEMVAALSTSKMEGGNMCGKTITVQNKDGSSINVKIVDTCPGCSEGDVDLSETAFKKLSPLVAGRIPITWEM
jgi:expansin (peptidoglycan-binding protein)